MVKETGIKVGVVGLHAGMAAIVLYGANLVVWSVLAGLLGSSMALIGLGLIMWALYPIRSSEADEVETQEIKAIEYADAQPA